MEVKLLSNVVIDGVLHLCGEIVKIKKEQYDSTLFEKVATKEKK